MSFNLRLPPALDAAARARSETLGISLNAFVCVALDAYLKGVAGSSGVVETGHVVAQPVHFVPPTLRPLPFKPGAKLSKSERARLHNLKYEKSKLAGQRDLLKND